MHSRAVRLNLCLAFFFFFLYLSSACPTQCSCFYHKISNGSKARSVLCNDPDLTSIPTPFPSDTIKLRIEKTSIIQVSSKAFMSLISLKHLWMSFNSLSVLYSDSFCGLIVLDELRMEGNHITSFPWKSLSDMPNLRLLDLHNNKISSISAEAASYINNLTYLDLSSNNLTTLPPEVLMMWFSPKSTSEAENAKIILGLHDNPWRCDCRLFGLVHFQKSPSSTTAFINTHMLCSEPVSLSGVFFSDVELQRCQAPRVHTAVTKVRSSLGNNVLLRCGTVGVPMPELIWSRGKGKAINGTVRQEVSNDGIIWSILSLPSVSYHDSGKYICKATNFVGSSSAIISLVITDTWQVDEAPIKTIGVENKSIGQTANQEKLISRYIPLTASGVLITDPLTSSEAKFIGTGIHKVENYSIFQGIWNKNPTMPPRTMSGTEVIYKDVLSNLAGNLAANASSLQQRREKRVVRSVKVTGDTDHTISINWRAPSATNTTSFSVLYAVFGGRNMTRMNVGPGKTRVTIEGLVPKTKYIACVCEKGLIPKKEQCVIFSTDEAASASGTQKLINVVVITVACVIAVPLTLIVCCGALKRRLQKILKRRSKDMQDSYVTFETLSPGPKAKGMEFRTHINQDESNCLLSARTSVDSEAIARTDGHPNEYFC